MAVDRSQNRSAYIGAGLAVLCGGLFVSIVFVPDILRSFTSTVELVAVMPQAGALERTSKVWIAGKEVGTVLVVELRPANVDSIERVAVRMSIPREDLRFVRKDSEVRITTARLIGEPVVDISAGSPGQPPVADGDTLRTRAIGSLEGLLTRSVKLSEMMHTLFAELESIERVGTDVRQRELLRLNRNLTATLGEFRDLMGTLRSSPINTLSDPEFKQVLNRLSTRSRELSAALRGAAERARRAQSSAQPSLTRLAARGDTIRLILEDIQARIDASGGGLLIRAQTDSAIVKALHEAQVQLDSLVAESKRNPLRFWF